MLLQTNSYVVPKERRAEHARLLRRFRQALAKLGCDSFEVYEQVGANWSSGEPTGRYVQIMRFRDRRHQLSVQAAERVDPAAQAIIAEFCQLINFPYQQQQGLFAVGFYNAVLQASPARSHGEGAGAVLAAGAAAVEAHEAALQAVEPADGPAGEHENYNPDADALADAAPESPVAEETLAEETLAEADGAYGDAEIAPADENGLAPHAGAGSELEAPPEGVPGAAAEEAGADEAAENEVAASPFARGEEPSESADDDDLSSLLDTHLDEGAAPEHATGPGPEGALDEPTDDQPLDKFEALDALDIDDLDLPDSPLAGPEQQQNRFRR
jgi:hypothetical protein